MWTCYLFWIFLLEKIVEKLQNQKYLESRNEVFINCFQWFYLTYLLRNVEKLKFWKQFLLTNVGSVAACMWVLRPPCFFHTLVSTVLTLWACPVCSSAGAARFGWTWSQHGRQRGCRIHQIRSEAWKTAVFFGLWLPEGRGENKKQFPLKVRKYIKSVVTKMKLGIFKA